MIHALGGNDMIQPLGGDDTICPGTGRDIVKGGTGDDTFVAEATPDGSDDFVGDGGQDTVRYFSRTVGVNVSLDGEPNDGHPDERDNVRLSVENVSGSAQGDNFIAGNEFANALTGGAGNDDLRGGAGPDTLLGGNGDDLLIGNAGNDFLFGNGGDDTALAAAVEDGADFVEGGTGTDTASYEGRATPVSVSLNNVANDGAPGEGDNIRLDVENVYGGSGNDVITATLSQSNSNVLMGGAGTDILDSREPFLQTDTVDGGGASNDVCLTDDDDIRINCP